MFSDFRSFKLVMVPLLLGLALLLPLPALATDVVQTDGEDDSDEWEIDLPTEPAPEVPGPEGESDGPYRLEICPAG